MAAVAPTHSQGGIHVHVVARKVQADQQLEDDGQARFRRAEEHQQTRRGASIGDHV